jgi:hypothetical protein
MFRAIMIGVQGLLAASPRPWPAKEPVPHLAHCPDGTSPSRRWSASELVNHTFTEIETDHVLEYVFSRSGYVSVTAGPAKGPVTAPVFQWRVKAGLLVILDGKRVVEAYRKLCSGPDRVLAAAGRQRVLFAVRKDSPSDGSH